MFHAIDLLYKRKFKHFRCNEHFLLKRVLSIFKRKAICVVEIKMSICNLKLITFIEIQVVILRLT